MASSPPQDKPPTRIMVKCPCGARWDCDQELAGRQDHCPECSRPVWIPDENNNSLADTRSNAAKVMAGVERAVNTLLRFLVALLVVGFFIAGLGTCAVSFDHASTPIGEMIAAQSRGNGLLWIIAGLLMLILAQLREMKR